MRSFLLLICMTSFLGSNSALAEEQYTVDHSWGKSLANYPLGQTMAVAVDSHNHIFVFHRASRTAETKRPTVFVPENTVLMVDGTTGEILKEWGANTFVMPHGLSVDSHDNVWVTDVEAHTVQKFSHDGSHIMTLGTHMKSGDDPSHFNKPAGIAFSASGDIFIADGYINTRVAKFSADGEYIMAWGKPGKGAGEFDLVHAISVSSDNLVYVADRTNSRLQVFDTKGQFIKIIPKELVGRPYGVAVNKDGRVFAVDGGFGADDARARVVELDKGGDVKTTFDTNHDHRKSVRGHGIAVGADSAIYVADLSANRVVKVITRLDK